jgi:thymidylate kinase
VKRRAFTVALIGPDGAGKTTIARRIEETFPHSVKYLYMGVNPEASNRRLLTTRLVHSIRARRSARAADTPPRDSGRPRSTARTALWSSRHALALVNRLAEEWYRYLIAWSHVRRGEIVVFDRHFYADYHASDVAAVAESKPKPIGRRIHGFLLFRLYPKPDLLIYLDASPEVLFKRKGEGTLDSLERRRRDYVEVVKLAPQAVVVDANRALEDVTRDVAEAIRLFAETGRAVQPVDGS